MAAYDAYLITALNDPVSELADVPTLDAAALKEWFDKSPTQLKNAINAIIAKLGTDKDAYDAWKAQLEALNLEAGAAAALAAAVAVLQTDQATANTNIADRELKTLTFTNQAVATTGWETYTASGGEETALYADGYTYRKSLALTGVLASMRILESAMSYSTLKCGTAIWTNAQTYDGGIKLYAKGTPTSAFTILSISFGRA